MVKLGLNEREDSNGRDWRPAVIFSFGTVLFAVMGGIATFAVADRQHILEKAALDSERITRLEERDRATQDQLQRIEQTVNELRQLLLERRR